MKQPLRVLLVDDRYAGRSRMAEAILRARGGHDFRVASAGVEPQTSDPRTPELPARFNMDAGSEHGAAFQRVADQRFDFVTALRDERAGMSD